METMPFTHAVTEDGEIIHKFRSKQSAEWFINSRPSCKIVKLEVPKQESVYNRMLNLVGECIL